MVASLFIRVLKANGNIHTVHYGSDWMSTTEVSKYEWKGTSRTQRLTNTSAKAKPAAQADE